MDIATINYYANNAHQVAERYESIVNGLSESFGRAFRANSKILDIGCGSGRDLALLTTLGHECFGIDATPEFVSLSQRIHPELHGKISHASLPEFEPPFGGNFNGVLCSAVLMHVPEHQLVQSARTIKQCLKKGGRFLYSVPSKRLDVVTENRDVNGRLFIPDHSNRLQTIFESLDFRLVSTWKNSDSLGRDSVEWISVLMELINDEDQ